MLDSDNDALLAVLDRVKRQERPLTPSFGITEDPVRHATDWADTGSMLMGATVERGSVFSRSDEVDGPAPEATTSKGKVLFVEPSVSRFESSEAGNKTVGGFDGVATTLGKPNVWETGALKEEADG
ncbi:hypothetical protein ACA910_011544 [Epithemia clementina (nom. ined.)]